MKVGDLNALDLGFWWVQRADSTELTIIKITTDYTFDEDEDGFGELWGVIMGSDRYQKIDDYLNSMGSPQFNYTFIERIQEPGA
jgi:hypothetical protein